MLGGLQSAYNPDYLCLTMRFKCKYNLAEESNTEANFAQHLILLTSDAT